MRLKGFRLPKRHATFFAQQTIFHVGESFVAVPLDAVGEPLIALQAAERPAARALFRRLVFRVRGLVARRPQAIRDVFATVFAFVVGLAPVANADEVVVVVEMDVQRVGGGVALEFKLLIAAVAEIDVVDVRDGVGDERLIRREFPVAFGAGHAPFELPPLVFLGQGGKGGQGPFTQGVGLGDIFPIGRARFLLSPTSGKERRDDGRMAGDGLGRGIWRLRNSFP